MAVTAAPSLGIGTAGYPFVFIQPLGAALGAVAGIVVLGYRWRRTAKAAARVRRAPNTTATYLETARRQRPRR
jgi:uncharacterized membrane protein YccC